MKRFLSVLILLVFWQQVQATLPIKRDDFIGTINRQWWHWHNDGPNTPMPAVLDGLVLFSLVDPVIDFDPFCDAALWDGYPGLGGPYHFCRITLRARALNPPKLGSRGWGLWYTEPYPNLQNQAWFMRVHDSTGSGYTGLDWWRAETANGRTEATHNYTDLDVPPHLVNDQKWHVYQIIRDTTYIAMVVDRDTVLYVTENLPEQDMAFHIWVDNLIYEHVDPDIINTYKREWTGKNEIVLDYVQIISPGTVLSKSVTPAGVLLLREISNEIYADTLQVPWKDYNFTAPGGNVVVLITARVEQYLNSVGQAISFDDDIRVVVGSTDYGWNTSQSFNGDAAGSMAKTLLLEQVMNAGTQQVQIYAETSPLLYDVTVLGSDGGGLIFDQEYNETKAQGSDSLWKEISFVTRGGEVAIYVAGEADEDPTPSNYGYQYSDFDDSRDDDLRLELDGQSFGYHNDSSLWGNRQFGEPKSILLRQNLSAGSHTLRLYAHGTPTLYRVTIYGENDDTSLPVLIKNFTASAESNDQKIKLNWATASEVNLLGFNIWRVGQNTPQEPGENSYQKINTELIPAEGSENFGANYSYLDAPVDGYSYYWYKLEAVELQGDHSFWGPLKVQLNPAPVPDQILLSQNAPNPFSTESHVTKIELRVNQACPVELSIFNIRGQRVYFARRFLEKGRHQWIWDGKDDKGRRVPVGLYFYQLKTPEKQLRKKMVLIH